MSRKAHAIAWAWRCECGHVCPPLNKADAEAALRAHLKDTPHRDYTDVPLFPTT